MCAAFCHAALLVFYVGLTRPFFKILYTIIGSGLLLTGQQGYKTLLSCLEPGEPRSLLDLELIDFGKPDLDRFRNPCRSIATTPSVVTLYPLPSALPSNDGKSASNHLSLTTITAVSQVFRNQAKGIGGYSEN
jgi:hypothetical protein